MMIAKGERDRGMHEKKKKKMPNVYGRGLDSNRKMYLSGDNNESTNEVESTTVTTTKNKPVRISIKYLTWIVLTCV